VLNKITLGQRREEAKEEKNKGQGRAAGEAEKGRNVDAGQKDGDGVRLHAHVFAELPARA
jgi:hypothetical protein